LSFDKKTDSRTLFMMKNTDGPERMKLISQACQIETLCFKVMNLVFARFALNNYNSDLLS